MDYERIAKWLFWIGVILFIGGAPVATLAMPVQFFFPLLFAVPYLYIQVQKGMSGANNPAKSEDVTE